jgi:hypothetical protein
LEDVPGAANKNRPTYNPRIDHELVLAKQYVERVCAEEGVQLER